MNGALLNSSRQDPGDARAWPEPSAPALVCCGINMTVCQQFPPTEKERASLFPGRSQGAPFWKASSLCLMQSPWNILVPTPPIACKLVPPPRIGHGSTPHSTRNQPTAPPKIGDDQSSFIRIYRNAVLTMSYFWNTETCSNLRPDTIAKMCK